MIPVVEACVKLTQCARFGCPADVLRKRLFSTGFHVLPRGSSGMKNGTASVKKNGPDAQVADST